MIDDFDFMGSATCKRIPEPLEAAVAGVLFVDGGEFGDALLDEEECGPPIVGGEAKKMPVRHTVPEVIHGSGMIRAGIVREADQEGGIDADF